MDAINYETIGRESNAYQTTLACFALEGISLNDDVSVAINIGKLVMGVISREEMMKSVAESLNLEG